MTTDTTVNVRYLVDDVQAAIDSYTLHVGLLADRVFLPAFADVRRGNLVIGPGGRQIVLDDPAGSPVELFQPADS